MSTYMSTYMSIQTSTYMSSPFPPLPSPPSPLLLPHPILLTCRVNTPACDPTPDCASKPTISPKLSCCRHTMRHSITA